MPERYIVTVNETDKKGLVRIFVIDQRRSDIIYDSLQTKGLLDIIKLMMLDHYGHSNVMFNENIIKEPLQGPDVQLAMVSYSFPT